MPAKQAITRSLLSNGSCLQCIRRTPIKPLTAARPFSSTPKPKFAAPEIDFSKLPAPDVTNARIIPKSPSYFTTQPGYTDDLIILQSLENRYKPLPSLAPSAAPRVTWKTLRQYRMQVAAEVSSSRYRKVVRILQRLNRIHPSIMPPNVKEQIQLHRRAVDPLATNRTPPELDEYGRAYGHGRRKSSRAHAWLVEGDGQILINSKNLVDAFGRMHDRESAVWALKCTDRLDKYNVFVTTHGGGTTGQAESVTLAVAKALMVHEPALKPALRRAGCVTRDPRRVERKKPGHLKSRKMPAWVKR